MKTAEELFKDWQVDGLDLDYALFHQALMEHDKEIRELIEKKRKKWLILEERAILEKRPIEERQASRIIAELTELLKELE